MDMVYWILGALLSLNTALMMFLVKRVAELSNYVRNELRCLDVRLTALEVELKHLKLQQEQFTKRLENN